MNYVEEIFKVFRNFIFRDVMYLTSGTLVTVSLVLCWFKDLHKVLIIPKSLPDCVIFLLGLSLILLIYAFGYGLQEVFSVFKIINTNYNKPKSKFMLWILTNFMAGSDDQWTSMTNRKDINVLRLWNECDKIKNDSKKSRMSRTINLMQIGTALTPGLFISFLIVFIRLFKSFTINILFVASILFLFSLIMLLVSKLKNYQLSLMLNDEIKNSAANLNIEDETKV